MRADSHRGDGVVRLLDAAADRGPGGVSGLVDELCSILGARSARVYVADYSLVRLQLLDANGPVGGPVAISGTVVGHAFTTERTIVTDGDPTVVSIPLVDGASRIGVLEFDVAHWDGGPPDLDAVVAVFVLLLVANIRYSDVWHRARRAASLSTAAEIQWELLPPLSCSTDEVGVGGILQPAYEIGGDSFDYAISGDTLDLAIVDAIGRGMSAVLMSTAAISSLRNSRREHTDLVAAYHAADELIANEFGRSYYVTAQFGSLDLGSGQLTWVNAGHVPPLLVRNGTFAGELACRPSLPLGLGGPVVEVGRHTLQRGDWVLFYTDGITESRSPEGLHFGEERLVDHLVRAALDAVPVAETARRLSYSVVEYAGEGLSDDATLLLVEYRGRSDP